MTKNDSEEPARPGSLADRLLANAEENPDVRTKLVDRWARAEIWTLVEGIALAWTLDPSTLGRTELHRTRPEHALPEEARHYLGLAYRSSALKLETVTPARFIAWADSVGLAFHADWRRAIDRSTAAIAQVRAQRLARRRQILVMSWARAPYWAPEEGVALACDLNPKEAIYHPAGGYSHPTLKAHADGNHLLELARRAVEMGALDEQATPRTFMAWAKTVRVEFHPDWWTAIAIEESPAETVQVSAPPPQDLKTKERETLTKMVAGMAMAFYGWDRDALRSKSTSVIASDLERVGVSFHPDTIRKWLREGADHIANQDR